MTATDAKADTVSTVEAAELLGVSRQRIDQLRVAGKLEPVGWGPGGVRLYRRTQVKAMARAQRRTGRPRADS